MKDGFIKGVGEKCYVVLNGWYRFMSYVTGKQKNASLTSSFSTLGGNCAYDFTCLGFIFSFQMPSTSPVRCRTAVKPHKTNLFQATLTITP